MKTRLPGVGEIERRRTIDRRRDWYESCAMIHGPEERKKNTRKSACDCAKAQPFILYKPASFEEPVSETRRRYRFALRCFRGRGCTAAGRSCCSAGTAKKSSHPWHFRCWSLRRNELECTDLVHWTAAEALHRFSSRDAIIVVGFVLEKLFDGDFTTEQEKEITFKRWPPGYQSWKLGLALNGLTTAGLSHLQCHACKQPLSCACLGLAIECSDFYRIMVMRLPLMPGLLSPHRSVWLPGTQPTHEVRSRRNLCAWQAHEGRLHPTARWACVWKFVKKSSSCYSVTWW